MKSLNLIDKIEQSNVNSHENLLMNIKSALYNLIDWKILSMFLPLTLIFLPLTDLLKKIIGLFILVNIFVYICKKNKTRFFMLNLKGIFLFFVLFISSNILVDKCFGCDQINTDVKNNSAFNSVNFNRYVITHNHFQVNSSTKIRKLAIGIEPSFLALLSEDNPENQPFINLDFSLTNSIPEFEEDHYKLRFGLDDRSFHLLMKHTTSSICILSFNSLQQEHFLSFVVPIDDIILFRQIQI